MPVKDHILALCSKILARENDQQRWMREVRALSRESLNEDDRQFVLMMKSRIDSGLSIHEQHGRRIDKIGEQLQADSAW